MMDHPPSAPSTRSGTTDETTPVYFFDTNALVQGYLPSSPGSSWARAILSRGHGSRPVVISELARVEFRSSLYKLERTAGTHPSFTDAVVNRFDRDVRLSLDDARRRLYTIVPLADDVVERARALLQAYRSGTPHAVRSLDALQLAAAAIAREALPAADRASMTFVTSDRQLVGVASHEGFVVVRPEAVGGTP